MRPAASLLRLFVVSLGFIGLMLATIVAIPQFPIVQVSASTPGITANCNAAVEDSSYTPVTAVNGKILFGCSHRAGWPPTWMSCQGGCPTAYPAFNVSQTANYTPIFNLPQYYTGLFVATTTGCSPPSASGPPPPQINNGTAIQLSGVASSPSFYYYCGSYQNVTSTGGTLSGFSITWTSGSAVFTQTIPSFTIPSASPPPPAMNGCMTTTVDSPVMPVKGTLEFDCIGGGPYPAFAVLNAGNYTPSFTLPQYYTGLSITPIADFVSNCANPAPGYPLPITITSGAQVFLTNHTDSGGYYYCPSYANVPMSGGTLPSFTVSWGQGTTLLTQTVPSVTVPASNDPPIGGAFRFDGVAVTVSGSVIVNSGSLSGTVSVSATNSSTGAVVFSKSYTISSLPLSNGIARFLLNIAVSPYPLSADVTVMQNGGVWCASVVVTRQLDINASGIVDITDFSTLIADYGSSPGSTRYNPAADLTASGTIDIVDVSLGVYFYGATVFY
jgi:hypothetical protein